MLGEKNSRVKGVQTYEVQGWVTSWVGSTLAGDHPLNVKKNRDIKSLWLAYSTE